ncbi:outer membrane beta-barrel protein [Photobacterium rosenbergii]|nr:outer membrane beta-barrel protein [Photobacterium rosenbergii]
MKKLTFIATAALLLSGIANASDTVNANNDNDGIKYFGGLGLSDGTVSNIGGEFEYNFRAGAIINDTHRLTGTYAYGDDSRASHLFASYDYMVGISENQKWNWFIGASAGYAVFKKADNDWTLGAQTGIQYSVNENYSLELGYRVIDTWDEWKDRNMSQLDSFYFAVDYKF